MTGKKLNVSQMLGMAVIAVFAWPVLATLVFSSVAQAQSSNQSQSSTVPVFTITPVQSRVTFYVKSSVKLEGTFEKWDATLVFTSTDASTGCPGYQNPGRQRE